VGNLTLLCRWTSEISPFPKARSSSTTFKCPLNTPKYNGNILLRVGSPFNMSIVTLPSLDIWHEEKRVLLRGGGCVLMKAPDENMMTVNARPTQCQLIFLFLDHTAEGIHGLVHPNREGESLCPSTFGFSSTQIVRNNGLPSSGWEVIDHSCPS